MARPVLIFVLPRNSLGGAERVIAALANYFAVEYKVKLIVLKKTSDKGYHISSRVDVIYVNGIRGLFSELKNTKLTPQDVVFSSFVDVNILLCIMLLILNKKNKLVLREALSPKFSIFESGYPLLVRLGYKLFYRRAAYVVCLTPEMKRDLLEWTGLASSKVKVIENFRSSESNERLVWSRPEGELQIVSVGRLTYQKGYDVLIDAFAKLAAKYPALRVSIVGAGEDECRLKLRVEKLQLQNRIRFMGALNEPMTLVCQSSFYVMSSRYEGFSNALFEAAISGVPVVATAKDTGASLLVRNGVNGYLVEKSDPELLAQGIEVMINSLSEFKMEENRKIAQDLAEKMNFFGRYNSLLG